MQGGDVLDVLLVWYMISVLKAEWYCEYIASVS